MNAQQPFSQACENNKQPILETLRPIFHAPGTVLEIGTGTGQHAVHMAAALQMGIRDIEDLTILLRAERMALTADHAIPANNELLVFTRVSSA